MEADALNDLSSSRKTSISFSQSDKYLLQYPFWTSSKTDVCLKEDSWADKNLEKSLADEVFKPSDKVTSTVFKTI